ncbi:hypothetical protein PENSPDRAFT_695182 [Peniophora sp. CONT]|nr:hypothetical protein PENSPDRAFT_695182 [Peniophora sp. CONT]
MLTEKGVQGDTINQGDTVNAFIHFAYVYSGYEDIYADMQSYKQWIDGTLMEVFFDPMVHTSSTTDVSGVGDHGKEGIEEFVDQHVCGLICKVLELEGDFVPMLEGLVDVE